MVVLGGRVFSYEGGTPVFPSDEAVRDYPGACIPKDICPIEQWSQSSGSNIIPRGARPGLAGLRPHKKLAPPGDTVPCRMVRMTLPNSHS